MLMPFLFYTLHDVELSGLVLKKPSFVHASDDIKLAYYPYMPDSKPIASLIFYHGAGAWSCAYYQYMATKLAEKNIAVFLVDIRGHGNSEGYRGDAPSEKHVFEDITTMINIVSESNFQTPIILGGHSAGAALVMNYNLFYENPLIKGYFLCAPYLGPHADFLKANDTQYSSFIQKTRLLPLIVYSMSNGWLCAHWKAIWFNYPVFIKQNDPHILDWYTCVMTYALSIANVKTIFEKIKKPLSICIGRDDEQFDAHKVVNYGVACKGQYRFKIVNQANHFAILTDYIDLFVEELKAIILTSDT